jgi:F420-dependent oxidoreductase-like protein
MKLALQLPSFTLAGGASQIADRLTAVATLADEVGYDSLWVMDHFFQIQGVGEVTEPMLEGYTTLSYLAAHTSRLRLGTMVTGVTYRQPGILAKEATTLDVLSGGRAWLGIGAGWNEQEHQGLGVPFPPLKERFERLEEAIQIALQMWDESNNGPYEGRYYRLAQTLNHPQALSQPHPPIMIGGGGERKTLRLVARYADAWNVSAYGLAGDAELRHKLAVLRGHCAAEGRSYDAIEKTVLVPLDATQASREPSTLVSRLRELAAIGFQTAILSLRSMEDFRALEAVSRTILPQAAAA